jgi:two-component system copper resistance phosphate regulon response regulator CusR
MTMTKPVAGLKKILREQGYRVALADSGQDGWDYLQTHEAPDLIIVDVLLQAMDGWQFLKQRKTEWATVPVLVVTSRGIASHAWAGSLTASCWLSKPVSLAAVLERVRTSLTSPEVN